MLAIKRGVKNQFQAAVGSRMTDRRLDEVDCGAAVSLPGGCDAQSPKVGHSRVVLRNRDSSNDNAVCLRHPEVILRPPEIGSFYVIDISGGIAGVETSGQETFAIQSQYIPGGSGSRKLLMEKSFLGPSYEKGVWIAIRQIN